MVRILSRLCRKGQFSHAAADAWICGLHTLQVNVLQRQKERNIRMKLKRTMAMLMAGVMCAGALAGCGSKSDSGSAASKEGLKDLTFVIASRDEFMSSIEAAMKVEAEPLGYNIVTQDAQNESAKQIQYIETAVNGGADAVICLPQMAPSL